VLTDVCTITWCRCSGSVHDCGILCSRTSARLLGAFALALYVIVEYCAHGRLRDYLVQVLCTSARLLGAGALALYVIVEYCAHGRLRNYVVQVLWLCTWSWNTVLTDICAITWCRCSVRDGGILCPLTSARLLGAGALYVIVEYCAHGRLHDYLVQVLCT